MSLVSISVDGQQVQAEEGSRLLWAILEAGLWVPNLCAMPQMEPPRGSCRLCWVQVDGRDKPVTSCTERVREGMVVSTRSEAVDRLVRAGFEMIISTHRKNCRKCPADKNCALQQIADRRDLKKMRRGFPKIAPDWPIDDSRADLGFNPNHCILCGKCIYVCTHEVGRSILAFRNRGLKTVVSTFDGEPLAEQDCQDCTRCAEACPVGALYLKDPAPASD